MLRNRIAIETVMALHGRQIVLITEGGCPTERKVGGSSDLFQRAV